MKKLLRFLVPAFAGLVSLAVAQTPAPAPVPATPMMAPTTPVDASVGAPKVGNKRFFELHDSFLARGKAGPIGVLFLGDSITEGWGKAPHIWEHYFGKYQPANFGIGGDQTQHVIWRIENGELDGISPKVVVLMIGTNNSASHTGEQIADAVKKIIDLTRTKIPGVKVLLLAILPRDARRNTDGLITEAAIEDAGKRVAANDRANDLLAKLGDGVNVRFLNTNAIFLGRDGKIPWTIMPDQLHPTAAGYQLWAEAIEKPLAEMMK
ncbi:GDSL-type esterase/lipase family protein [Opitutus sp. GAS368]|jgi:lysophospholipase L1-like esterase|uniref:GDSL-type esterase/lipase family protein n=1 Tax=Opitutus sp. GAS368 TaxID=1882749 RepID=UPI00087DD5B8|nr:GDSL-type esterase/lipase family protein [Opitutus sp. GAS368]SDR92651.1 beta-glucosidase [Opitutus sp. GAS368]